MTFIEEYTQSFYQELAPLRENHDAMLVQHAETQKFFVKKRLGIYDLEVFQYLKDHPIANMPRIIELAEDDGVLIVIEQYISGDTIQELLDNRGLFTETQTIDIICQLCRIVSELHHAATPIIHRDIKPSNIILSPDGVVKLLDMNAAKLISDTKTQDTVLMGTAGYAAPEQYGFASSNVQADIYAIGVLMNVMLTGQFPQNELYTGRVKNIIQNCTKIDWKSRYHSIDEVEASLRRLQSVQSFQLSEIKFEEKYPYLLPGMRSGNPVCALLSVVGYSLLGYCAVSLRVKDASTLVVVINRIVFAACFLSIILFTGNYLNIKSIWKVTASENILVRWLGTVMVDISLLFAWIAMLVLLEATL